MRLVNRPLRALLLLAAVPLVTWIALDIYLFATPSLDRPVQADAVIVLAGDRTPRLDRGLGLMRAGVAPTLVISDGHDPNWPAANRLCAEGSPGFRVVCFKPDPYSTRGEARGFARLAREGGSLPDIFLVDAHASLGRLKFNVVTEVGKLLVQVTVERGC